MSRLRARLRDLLGITDEGDDVLDFLGVVVFDRDNDALVLGDQMVALLEVTGSTFLTTTTTHRKETMDAYRDFLNRAVTGFEVIVDVRPYDWNLPGNYLDGLADQVARTAEELREEAAADPVRAEKVKRQIAFMERRLAAFREDIDSFGVPVACRSMRHVIALRYPLGTGAVARSGDDPAPMYLPPPRSLRLRRQVRAFVARDDLRAWHRARISAARSLEQTVLEFRRDLERIPDLRISRIRGVELANLLQLMWRGEEAHEGWIDDEAALAIVANGELTVTEHRTGAFER